jgi:hypothetical protein
MFPFQELGRRVAFVAQLGHGREPSARGVVGEYKLFPAVLAAKENRFHL